MSTQTYSGRERGDSNMMKMGKNDGTKQTNERNGEGAFFIIPLIILLCKL